MRKKQRQSILNKIIVSILILSVLSVFRYHPKRDKPANVDYTVNHVNSQMNQIRLGDLLSSTKASSTILSSDGKWNINAIIDVMEQLTWEERNLIYDTVNGHEFPYPLTCPKQVIKANDFDVVVAYHVGMLNNWRIVVKDQMNTIAGCGLGSVLSKMIITYTSNSTENTLEQLQDIIHQYPFASKVTFYHSPGMPFEGTALNKVRQHCLEEKHDVWEKNHEGKKRETVIFYFHSKGVSRYTPNWRNWRKDRKLRKNNDNYARVLQWRKYMTYFLLERPELCIKKIIRHGAQACGVFFIDLGTERFYGGNFWASSCSYITTLSSIEIGSPTDKQMYYIGERWIGSNMDADLTKFANLHDPKDLLYSGTMEPIYYTDYSWRWGKK